VSGSTQLSKDEVERLVADAQSHAADDQRRREEVEARNTADAMAYQVERQLQELGPKVPVNEKARAEQLITEIRQLVQSNSTDVARLRQLAGDLQQLAAGLAEAPPNSRTAGDGGRREAPGPQHPGGPDDVIDAEFRQR
jgi:molecular chaperone DnaK